MVRRHRSVPAIPGRHGVRRTHRLGRASLGRIVQPNPAPGTGFPAASGQPHGHPFLHRPLEVVMPRGPIIVQLADGKDHLIIGTEVTGCGQLVPFGLEWQTSTTKPCKVCFPDGQVTSAREANESELIARQQEALGAAPVAERAPFEEGVAMVASEPEPEAVEDEPKAEPKKAAKKATKAG